MNEETLALLRACPGSLVLALLWREVRTKLRFCAALCPGQRFHGCWLAGTETPLWCDDGVHTSTVALQRGRDFCAAHGIEVAGEAGQPCGAGGVGCRT